MSTIRLLVCGVDGNWSGIVPGGLASRVVAALGADPATFEELQQAVRRFVGFPAGAIPLAELLPGDWDTPHDLGLLVIDLVGRLVAADPATVRLARKGGLFWQEYGPEGEVETTEVNLPFELATDWLFSDDLETWRDLSRERREAVGQMRLDFRKVLYGQSLFDYIAVRVWDEFRLAESSGLIEHLLRGQGTARWDLRRSRPRFMENSALSELGCEQGAGSEHESGLRESGLREFGLREFGLREFGLDESGLDESGLDESGLDESGLGESGLGESGLEDGDPPLERFDFRGSNAEWEIIKRLHVDWLLTPRSDLGERSPRQWALADHERISNDLDDQAQRWSLLEQEPPSVAIDSIAYRFSSFGTHEWVEYYEFVRELLWDSWFRLLATCSESTLPERARRSPRRLNGSGNGQVGIGAEVLGSPAGASEQRLAWRQVEATRLAQRAEEWLDAPEFALPGERTPRSIIERERCRLPELVAAEHRFHDPDCPVCELLAKSNRPAFWSLDGCNFDDDYAFDQYSETEEEWREKQIDWRQFVEKSGWQE